jgi:hypothetical protein
MEAGEGGWNLIEFKELYQSACEFLSAQQIEKIVIDREQSYLRQVINNDTVKACTHYFYDPRTGSQDFWLGFFQSLRLAIFFCFQGITPIALLTDLPVRRWRMQVAIITAVRGLVVCLMSPREVLHLFPHKRLVGPSLMAFSKKTLNEILRSNTAKGYPDTKLLRAVFAGSLYEPRATTLNYVQCKVVEAGREFEILARPLGGARIADAEYWDRLSGSLVVFTTADQNIQPEKDPTDKPHLIYRYIEVLVCGSLLVAPEVPGLRQYFTPGEHFLDFSSPEEAIRVVLRCFDDPVLASQIAKNGQNKAIALIHANIYWSIINNSLGGDALV